MLLFAELRHAGHPARDEKVRDVIDDLIVDKRLAEQPGRGGAKSYRAIAASASQQEDE